MRTGDSLSLGKKPPHRHFNQLSLWRNQRLLFIYFF